MKMKFKWQKIVAAFLFAAMSLAMVPEFTGNDTVHASNDKYVHFASCTITRPVAGKSPSTVAVPGDDKAYETKVEYWYVNEGSYSHMSSGDKFELNKRYTVRVSFEPKEGYRFDDKTEFYINTDQGIPYSSSYKFQMIYTATSSSEPQLLEHAGCYITPPVDGEHPDYHPVSADPSKYEVVCAYWYTWEPPYTEFVHMYSDDCFEEGKQYKVRIKFIPKPGYRFEDFKTQYTVTGYPTTMYGTDAVQLVFTAKKYEYDGWVKEGDYWQYYEFGKRVTGWKQISGVWFYFESNGSMVTGWKQIDGIWYYFESNGHMAKGWLKVGGTWYYMSDSGAMVTGWRQISGVWYYFKPNGAMAANEYCGGYWLDASGAWTYKYKASWKQDSKGWWYGDDSGWYAKNRTLKIDGKNYNFDASGYCTNPNDD